MAEPQAQSSIQRQLNQLAKQPPATKVAILGGVLALLGAAYYFAAYQSLAEEETALQGQRRKLVDEERALRQRKGEYDELLKQKVLLEQEIKNNAVTLPTSAEIPAFFGHLQAQALAANVAVGKWGLEGEIPVETYMKVPVRLEVRGDFYQLALYFKLLNETKRIITVENLSIHSPRMENDRLVLTATFTASTFQQAPNPQPGVPGSGPDGAAGGQPVSFAPTAPIDPTALPPPPPPSRTSMNAGMVPPGGAAPLAPAPPPSSPSTSYGRNLDAARNGANTMNNPSTSTGVPPSAVTDRK